MYNCSRFLLYVCIFMFCVFGVFLPTKKDAHWNFAKICPIFSPWAPIWNHFVHFWVTSVPQQPGLKLKFAECIRNVFLFVLELGCPGPWEYLENQVSHFLTKFLYKYAANGPQTTKWASNHQNILLSLFKHNLIHCWLLWM